MKKTPPRLLARTLTVTFVTVAVILSVVFIVITLDVRDRVRAAETDKLRVSENVFTALETKRQQDQVAAMATLAENPTLKAALDTYFTERRFSGSSDEQLRATVTGEAAKLATQTPADVLAVVETNGRIFTSAGPAASKWPSGQTLPIPAAPEGTFQSVAVLPAGAFRVTGARLTFGDRVVGALVAGTSLDANYAQELSNLSTAGVVITVDNSVVARTVSEDVARDLVASKRTAGTGILGNEEYAIRAMLSSGPARIYTLTSIDAAARRATREALVAVATIAFGSFVLAAIGSLWLARILSEPINRVSSEIATMTNARDFGRRLELTGSSRELDALATAFNDLMRGLGAAEAETRSAYLGAIRALAAALDARDPYTAGHSERVSTLAVMIGRAMNLGSNELEVLRLGALLHDIGKIGVSDEILRKNGPLTPDEFEQIKRHPGLGARILRQVSFLTPHLPIVELHHERPDGRGYPFGLRAEEIPLDARIVHVADAFDAMTSARAYRAARPVSAAFAELERFSGTQFDPACVEALLAAMPSNHDIAEPALAQLLTPQRAGALGMVVLLLAAPVAAQHAKPSVLSIDSAASVDVTSDLNGNQVTGVFLDSLVVGDFGKQLQAIVRPQVQRLANTGEWNRQVWVAEMRYERQGPVAFRVEGGYIPSPVGLANLTLRPQMNPTIALPAELFTSIPSLEIRGPRINLLSGIYPLGAQATASATHWDTRVAVIDTSPLRLRRVFGSANPPRFANVVVGGGVTPFVGFRVGASFTHGGWLRAGESPAITTDRSANLVTVETELSFRHTSFAGEWVHDALDTSLGTRTASGWYVQGAQALAPHWFVAGRVDRIHTTLPTGTALEQDFNSAEQTLGYRLTPDITLRASHRLRQPFGRTDWDHLAAVSIVWYRRWM